MGMSRASIYRRIKLFRIASVRTRTSSRCRGSRSTWRRIREGWAQTREGHGEVAELRLRPTGSA